jgi:hypothetical protein
MAWSQYQLVLQLKSPLHIGYRKVGNLMQTRSYVTGKVLWAALTARLTRDLGNGTDGQAYVDIGNNLKQYFRFSYLWPAVPFDSISKVEKWDDLQTLFPFEENELKNQKSLRKLYPHPQLVKSAYFDYCFLDSYAGTALDQHNFTADEGTLHDIEFIAPYIRINSLPVYLVGSLWVDESRPHELGGWLDELNRIRLGGEQSYGWGKVQCICCKPIEKDERSEDYIPDPDDFSWSGHIPAHIQVEQSEVTVQGIIEPLVGWERKTNGNQEIGHETIAFVPGSYDESGNANFVIKQYGVWKKL